MRKLNNKGYLIIELILASALAMTIAYFLLNMVVKISNKNEDLYLETELLTDKALMTNVIMEDVNSYTLTNVIVYEKNAEKKVIFLTFCNKETNEIVKNATITLDKNNRKFSYVTSDKDGTESTYTKKINSKITDITLNVEDEDNNNLHIQLGLNTLYSNKDYGINIDIPHKYGAIKVMYNIRVTVDGGTIDDSDLTTTTLNVENGGNATVKVIPKSDYTLNNASVTCDSGIADSAEISKDELTITNVMKSGKCEVYLKKKNISNLIISSNEENYFECVNHKYQYLTSPIYVKQNTEEFIIYSIIYDIKGSNNILGYKAILKTPISQTKWCAKSGDACFDDNGYYSRLYTPRARIKVGDFTSDYRDIQINRSLKNYINTYINKNLLLKVSWGGAPYLRSGSTYNNNSFRECDECNATGQVTFNFESEYGLMTYCEYKNTEDFVKLYNYSWWLLTLPNSGTYVNWYVDEKGDVAIDNVTTDKYLRPVIAIKADTLVTGGSGTKDDPYIISSE